MAKTEEQKCYYSPSEYHKYLMDKLRPALHYENQDPRTWQKKLRKKIRSLIGLYPASRTDLKVRKLWQKDHPLGTIEKIVFRSEPYVDVCAYVCLPKKAKPPYSWFICLQGHSTGMHNSIALNQNETDSIKIAGDRDFALNTMAQGMAALCLEQRSFGQRQEKKQKNTQGGCQDASMHALMLGHTLLAERVFDVNRAIDFLYTRKDVNRKKIGVMGNSGGGTISVFAAALLPRLAYSMPSCYFCTFRDSIMSIGHCVCNYVPGLLQYAEMSDVMGLFAPKPLVLVAGKNDPIFPIAATRRAYKHLKTIYRAFNAENNCRLVIGPEGHRFYADLAWPKMRKLMKQNG